MARHVDRLPHRHVGSREPAIQQVIAPLKPPLKGLVALGQALGLQFHQDGAAHAVLVEHDVLLRQDRAMLADGLGEMHPDEPLGTLGMPRQAA